MYAIRSYYDEKDERGSVMKQTRRVLAVAVALMIVGSFLASMFNSGAGRVVRQLSGYVSGEQLAASVAIVLAGPQRARS